jgi:hypothetical protein
MGSTVDSNYYDLALALYLIYYRTGDNYWLSRARNVAQTWRDDPLNQGIMEFVNSDGGRGISLPPRSFSTLGLAILAVEAGDAGARRVVLDQANLIEFVWGIGNGALFDTSTGNGDGRERGYALMALVAAHLLGEDHSSTARGLVDIILASQQPAGYWQSTYQCGGSAWSLNYMNGILMEGMILYDRVFGDGRIVPSLRRFADWAWATQWTGDSFYYNDQCGGAGLSAGSSGPNYAILNGLMLPAWNYLALRTGSSTYRSQADQILGGLVIGNNNVLSERAFGEAFRSSSRYLP